MKINELWLREWINPKVDSKQLAEQLTMAGMEVESVESIDVNFSGVVVALVESVELHPGANKLKVCKVNCGNGETFNVVCGANNVRPGMLVPLARVNAKLPDGNTITATELKGVISEGMLCSAAELDLADVAEGLFELPADTTPGQDLGKLLSAKDTIFDISLTPNRGDCLSICGIAREIALLNNFIFDMPSQNSVQATTDTERPVQLNAPEVCPHYVGRIIEDVDVSHPAPIWLTEKLRRCGVRSINPVVDIINYVMLEIGQPMHAFDNDKLEGAICVRYANESEKLTLLDQQEVTLTDNTPVIADQRQVLAMAGIMGGLDSAVIDSSRNIFLESAFFSPQAILGEARQYGMHTDSSHRFERGVDYTLQRRACERATQLILDICGGKPGLVIEATSEQHLPKNPTITLRQSQISRVLGINIEPEEVTEILQGLGMEMITGQESWQVTAPSHRFDIVIEADLIEEIARIYGYDNIPEQQVMAKMHFQSVDCDQQYLQKMCQYLVNQGYQEAITYSFVDERLQNLLDPENKALRLSNPIAADMAVMRSSIWPGLLQALIYNVNRQQGRVRLFETGLIFEQIGEEITQKPMLGGLIYGNVNKKQWGIDDKESDIFDIKGDIEGLLATSGQLKIVSFRSYTHPALHPGQSGEIFIDNQIVGCYGALHPELQLKLEITQSVFLFELGISRLSQQIDTKYQKLSKFPAVRRDLAVVLEENIPVDEVLECIENMATDMLYNLELFDVYQGEGIDIGKKSLALGLTFQRSSSTLTDGEVEAIVGEILGKLRNQFGATLRE